ncbi:MAG: hypothetical protein FWH53_02530 [Leptospirales bacterium]|nr:hypothetical protein [Leptospirales bacterium]
MNMFEKFIPVIIVLILIQLVIRFMKMKNSRPKVDSRNFDYKKRIDDFMKISNYDEGVGAGRKLSEEVRQGLGGDLIMGIPESMRDVRKNLNLIIDGVSHGVKAKIGERSDIIKYNNAAEMFDEILAIINRHKV